MVSRQGWSLARQVDWGRTTFSPGWFCLGLILYLIGWLPAVWFWRELIRQGGYQIPFFEAVRAHYCGQLGKYIPGKAGVVVIRAGMVAPWGVPFGLGALAAAYETITSMCVGAAVGLSLLPYVVPPETLATMHSQAPWAGVIVHYLPLVSIPICVLGLPALSRLCNFALKKMVSAEKRQGIQCDWTRQPSWIGLLALMGMWWIHGLSLGCVIQSVSPFPVHWEDWPRLTAASSLAITLGFFVLLAPGGLGVREWILMEILQSDLQGRAVLVAVFMRLVWLFGECGAAAVLYYVPRFQPPTDAQAAAPSNFSSE